MLITLFGMDVVKMALGLVVLGPLMAHDQIEVPQIDEYARSLADDEDRIPAVHRISEKGYPSRQTEVPEDDGNNAAPLTLTLYPLYDETHGKECLAGESDYQPEVC
jgi:hypothetical protein